jgi:hypothetical protein
MPPPVEVLAALNDLQAPAATVGNTPISGDYLYYLARTGDFARWADLVAFVEDEVARREQIGAHGVRVVPAALTDAVNRLEPRHRYALTRFERAYPLGLHPDFSPAAPAVTLPLVLDRSHADGRVVQILVDREADYEAERGSSGVRGVAVRAPNRSADRLAFGRDEHMILFAWWTRSPPQVRLSVLAEDGEEQHHRDVVFEPGWSRVRVGVEAKDRPDSAVIGFGAGSVDEPWLTRWFWQRDAPNPDGEAPERAPGGERQR